MLATLTANRLDRRLRFALSYAPMILLVVADLVAVLYYWFAMGWSALETARLALGATALWAPMGLLLYLLLGAEIPDRTVRLTLSAAASYTLTTLAYFALAVFHLGVGFFVAQVALTAGLIVYAVRRTRSRWMPVGHVPPWRQLDWVLVALVAVSWIVNIRYKMPFAMSPTGDATFLLFGDHFYHTGQVYELARDVPPIQQSIRAGTPERAYHMFSHLTTMLLARLTGQGDLLRVHLAYHYTVMETGLCLLFFSIAKTLTRSNAAGYIAVGLLYLGAFSLPPLVPSPFPFFYFTIFPDASSGLNPVRVTSPQMYSGLLVMYGVLLGVLLMSERFSSGRRSRVLPLVVALMVAASSRFRIQVFLPLLPGFVLIMVVAWWRGAGRVHLGATVTALLVSALLYLETRSDVYLPGTAGLGLGFNGVSQWPWVNSWPLAPEVFGWLRAGISDPSVVAWVWQCVSLPAFVVCNMIGLPLLVASVAYLMSRPARREHRWFSALIVWMVVISTVGAMVIKMDYDVYSVAGQLLLHTRWYLFPFLAIGIWSLYRIAQRRWDWPRTAWIAIAVAASALAVTAQQVTPVGGTLSANAAQPIRFDADEWAALQFLHDRTAGDAVILSNKYVDQPAFVFSGLTGRATYLEFANNPVDRQVRRLRPTDDRRQIIGWLWRTTDPSQFCEVLLRTGATHLVEYADQPLEVRDASCLWSAWVGRRPTVRIWGIRR